MFLRVDLHRGRKSYFGFQLRKLLKFPGYEVPQVMKLRGFQHYGFMLFQYGDLVRMFHSCVVIGWPYARDYYSVVVEHYLYE